MDYPDLVQAEVVNLPNCDFPHFQPTPARYDFKTKQGPWANGCRKHWEAHRFYPDLGTGKGQYLITTKETHA